MLRKPIFLIVTLVTISNFSLSYAQVESTISEPTYYSRSVVNIKLSDIPKKALYGLAYDIPGYDFNTLGNGILETIDLSTAFSGRKYDENIELFIPTNNLTIRVYSELLFLEKYKAKYGNGSLNNEITE